MYTNPTFNVAFPYELVTLRMVLLNILACKGWLCRIIECECNIVIWVLFKKSTLVVMNKGVHMSKSQVLSQKT
jgi:hypothetical protein